MAEKQRAERRKREIREQGQGRGCKREKIGEKERGRGRAGCESAVTTEGRGSESFNANMAEQC